METVWPPYFHPKRTPIPWKIRPDPPEHMSPTSPCATPSYETLRIKQEAWIRVLVYSTLHKFYPGSPCFRVQDFQDYLTSYPGSLNTESRICSYDEYHLIAQRFTENFMQRGEYIPLKLALNSKGDTIPAPEVVKSIRDRIERNMAGGGKGNFPNQTHIPVKVET